jgi:hypothetical protein
VRRASGFLQKINQEDDSMQKMLGRVLLLCMIVGMVGTVAAQEQMMSPPKVLVIIREFLKPGKAGNLHTKSESGFVNAFAAAKWPQHYLAMDSMSGNPRSLFFVGYESFAAWEKDNMATMKNATLTAALDRATIADGDLLASTESSTFVYREDQSFQANINVGQMRYFEISRFVVRPGHEKEWEAVVKGYQDGYAKAVPDAHWAVFQDMYGKNSGGVYIVISPLKSLAEIDKGFGDNKKFAAQIGEEGMKKLADLSASSIEEMESNLFAFNPAESYPPDAWVKSDPGFWKPKGAAAKTGQ